MCQWHHQQQQQLGNLLCPVDHCCCRHTGHPVDIVDVVVHVVDDVDIAAAVAVQASSTNLICCPARFCC